MNMNMGTSTMSMAMSSTTTASSMMMSATSTSMSDMSSGMDTMAMSSMVMTFFTSARTVLYATAWTPTSDGQYAGTCIFLIVLAAMLRFILAFRPMLEAHVWNDRPRNSHIIESRNAHVEEQQEEVVTTKIDASASAVSLVKRDFGSRWSGWRVNAAAGRATYDLVAAGIAYLLMLAVMTMNVGYFLSVLAGVWLGTFILGGAAPDNQLSH